MGQTALSYCVMNGDLACVNLLLAHGAAVNFHDAFGKLLLCEAAESGFHEGVVALLDAKADVTTRSRKQKTALQHALSPCSAVLLILQGSDLDRCPLYLIEKASKVKQMVRMSRDVVEDAMQTQPGMVDQALEVRMCNICACVCFCLAVQSWYAMRTVYFFMIDKTGAA
jgi:hypothetical protein